MKKLLRIVDDWWLFIGRAAIVVCVTFVVGMIVWINVLTIKSNRHAKEWCPRHNGVLIEAGSGNVKCVKSIEYFTEEELKAP